MATNTMASAASPDGNDSSAYLWSGRWRGRGCTDTHDCRQRGEVGGLRGFVRGVPPRRRDEGGKGRGAGREGAGPGAADGAPPCGDALDHEHEGLPGQRREDEVLHAEDARGKDLVGRHEGGQGYREVEAEGPVDESLVLLRARHATQHSIECDYVEPCQRKSINLPHRRNTIVGHREQPREGR